MSAISFFLRASSLVHIALGGAFVFMPEKILSMALTKSAFESVSSHAYLTETIYPLLGFLFFSIGVLNGYAATFVDAKDKAKVCRALSVAYGASLAHYVYVHMKYNGQAPPYYQSPNHDLAEAARIVLFFVGYLVFSFVRSPTTSAPPSDRKKQ